MDRKQQHIDIALEKAQIRSGGNSELFYEPLLSSHASRAESWKVSFCGKTMQLPLWISSMTGGTEKAKVINQNLAMACRDFQLGMGLGSCRALLDHPDDENLLSQFRWRSLLGDGRPFFANIGIAQLESLITAGELDRLHRLVDDLQADGVVVHVNPLQELFQTEGDRFQKAPVETLNELLLNKRYAIIVKEVGQGMGPKSLESLMRLPIDAIETAALGGTNFTTIEQTRSGTELNDFQFVGHTNEEMLSFFNQIESRRPSDREHTCPQMIISGGVNSALDAYRYLLKAPSNSLYGMASTLLRYAQGDYVRLESFLEQHVEQLLNARAFLIPAGHTVGGKNNE